MKYLTKLMKPYLYLHVLLLLFSVTYGILIISQSIEIGKVIDTILTNHHIDLPRTLALILFILIGRSMIQFFIKYIGHILSHRVKTQLRHTLMLKHNDVGETMNLNQQGIEGIHPFYADYIPQVYKSMIVPLLIIGFLTQFHYQTAIIMCITAPFIPIFYIIIGINTSKKATEQMLSLNHFSNYFLNVMKGIMTIKLFKYDNESMTKVEDYSNKYKQNTMSILKTAFLSTLMLEFIAMLSIGIIALEIGLSLIVFESISFYVSVVVLMLAPEFYNALKDLGLAFHTGKQSSGYGELLEEAVRQEKKETTIKYHLKESIIFDDVKLTFHQTHTNFQLNVSTEIPVCHYVIAGPSGSGKSTFAKVLANLEPAQGVITLPHRFKDNIVYLSQHPILLNTSVMNNITMFQSVDPGLVYHYAKVLKLHDLFMNMPDGYDTTLGDGERQLSGGEMRRLMLLRVFVQPKALVIFDEPTAMLDIESERIIEEAITQLKSIATVMVIAHHQHTIEQAEHCIVIKAGQVTLHDQVRIEEVL
ncbi:ABC transporter ATP-binding protein/permease [Macrococcoides caseolyticum]|uniref:ABC transporter ATP-binding protein/permease n=1 Tax=Macrococcoides caseolyticum TaxID=69966 RepID=UPI001F189150|nr:ABC transporter transmembrane domain-containing protein [Macrococcus caseolyticus]MCE4955906.1 ATP-binding cassette domain-containing protein [Macrococcus caseolyticus]